jgi:transcriptional regulator with XRE-family HTH domain
MVRARKKVDVAPAPKADAIDVNAVVSYNFKAIRERRGTTQQQVADALARLTGHQLPQASISAMERGYDGDRRRRFDAHELYLLSVVFDVPIAYFFVPPPESMDAELADTRRPVAELYRAMLGADHQLDAIDDRLAEIKVHNPDGASEVLMAIYGPDDAAGNWHEHFRTWRRRRLREVEVEYGDRLDEIADTLGEFSARIKALGPAGFLRSSAHRPGEPVDDEEAPA